jgi:hypothetical protein
LFDPLWRAIRVARVLRPTLIGVAGWIGVVVARHNVTNAPVVVGIALATAAIAVALRERGAALAAIGVAVASAFVATDGLGPFIVVTGVALATTPAYAHRVLAPWADVIDGLIALPALAGLATVVASEPSQRGAVVGAVAGGVLIASWLRPPLPRARPAFASFLGLIGGVAIAMAPQVWDRLGQLPASTEAAGRGLAAAIAVFAIVGVAEAVWRPRNAAAARGRHVTRRRSRALPGLSRSSR